MLLWDTPKTARGHNGQSHNLLQDSLILPNLVLNDYTHRTKENSTKIDKGQKFSTKLWLCAVMASRRFDPAILYSNFSRPHNKDQKSPPIYLFFYLFPPISF